MSSIGGAAGMAVDLNFPGQSRRGVVDAPFYEPGPFREPQTSTPDYLSELQGIQRDAAGMDTAAYESAAALKKFVFAAAKQGIDVTAAPDPRVPKSFAMVEDYNRALNQHYMNLDQLKQGKQLQNLIAKERMAGRIHVQDGIASMERGPMTMERMLKETYPTSSEFVDNVNARLAKKPQSQQEYDDLTAFRNQALREINNMVYQQEIDPASAEYYRSMIGPVAGFDDRLTREKIKSEQQRRAESRRRIKKMDDEEKDKIALAAAPELRNLAEELLNNPGEQGPGGLTSTPILETGYFEGKRLGGSGDYLFERIRKGPDGNYKVYYKATPENAKQQEFFNDNPDKAYKIVNFSKDDIWEAWQSTMPESQARQVRTALKKAGMMKDDKLSAEELMEFYGEMYPESEQASTASGGSNLLQMIDSEDEDDFGL